MANGDVLTLTSALASGVRVRRIGSAAWAVNEPQQQGLRLTRLIRIDNAGRTTSVTLRMAAVNPSWMSHLYLVQGQRVKAITGVAGAGRVTFTFDAPPGVSHVGPEIWYRNEDADRFIRRMLRRSMHCSMDSIGNTSEGRSIRRLTIGRTDAKHVVVVAGREHADEPSGSFAVEAVAEHVLDQLHADALYRDCRFDLIPIVNPDGVASGQAYPRPGKSTVTNPNPSDPHYCGIASDDPTVKAWREYLFAQRPAAFVNYHAYWALSFPQVIFYNKDDGLVMVDHLIHDDMTANCRWYVQRQSAESRTMLYHCVKKYGTVVGMFELPWRGRLVKDVRTLGLRMFLSVMEAMRRRKKSDSPRKLQKSRN